MRLQANGTDYVLHFTHHRDTDEEVEKILLANDGKTPRHIRWTKCEFHEGKCSGPIFECMKILDGLPKSAMGDGKWGIGIAFCNLTDNFTKATGRKLALERALRLGGFSKEQRKEIWKAYFQISRPTSNRNAAVRAAF